MIRRGAAKGTRFSAERRGTYYGLPLLKEPVWGPAIPTYFYLGGVAGAAAALGAAGQLVGGASFRRMVIRARRVAAVAAAVGAVLLIVDLGKPRRFLYMMRVFRPTSPMNLGTWVVAATGTASGLAALLGRTRAGDAAGIAAGLAGLPMAGYTAVLVSNTAVPAWNEARRSLPLLFIASAAASAASLFDALFDMSAREARSVRIFGVAAKRGELAAARRLERDLERAGESTARPLHEGRSARLWRGARNMTAASLAASLLWGGGRRGRLVSGLLGTAGAMLLRFAVIEIGKASARDPRAASRSTGA
jgi:hypothetical protein